MNNGVIDGKSVVGPVNPDELTFEEKIRALEAINLIAEKRDGRIKGRTCSNGSKQRKNMKDGENFSSPTVLLESIMPALIIDAYKGRSVGIMDVPGAYLHAKMPDNKIILL